MQSTDPSKKPPLPEQERKNTENNAEADQEKSDPPLTEIKGVTDPEEYIEPPVEDEEEDEPKR
jgi:hypothetical protein